MVEPRAETAEPTGDAPPAFRLPWYSFLYRLLGAQGTFWLWLIALLALWWTATPAMIRFANQAPRTLSVRAAANADPFTRWVRLEGVLIGVDRRLLRREGPATLPPVKLLLDPTDPAAQWWRTTRALCDARAGAPGAAALGDSAGLWPTHAQAELVRRLAELGGAPEKFLPAPERAIVVQTHETESLSPIAPDEVGGGPFDRSFYARLDAQIALVQQRVEPWVVVQGVLEEAPVTVVRRIRDETGIVPADALLLVGRKPRELERVVFMVALLILVLLTAGLFGARRAGRAASRPG